MDRSLHELVDEYRSGAISRRRFLRGALALGFSAAGAAQLLAACGGGTPSGASPSAAARATNPDGEVRMATAEDQWPVQGTGSKATTFEYPLNVNVFEPLVYLASDYTLKPGLATSWELVQPATFRFHLRRGVRFHDGSPFSADDVVWTFARALDAVKPQPSLSYPAGIGPGSVKKVDDFTVDITTDPVNLRLPEQILHPEESIIERNLHNDSAPLGGPGTGPFTVVEYVKGERAVLERNASYWGTKPRIKRLTVRFLPDPQTRLQALRAGEVDMVLDVPPTSVRDIASDSRFHVARSAPGRNQLIYVLKTGTPPHDLGADPAIRQAASMAIDRSAYVATVFDNNADPGRTMATPSVLGPYLDTVKPISYDPRAARRVLDQAGWAVGSDGIRAKGGRRLSLDMIGWAEVAPITYQFLQAQLKQVGIELNTKPAPDTPTYRSYYNNNAFDLDLEVPNQNDGNPAFLPVLRMYSKSKGNERFAPGAAFDAVAARTQTDATHADVQRDAAAMMKMLVDQDHIVIPLAGVKRIYAMTSNVELLDVHPSQTNQVWTSLVVYR